MILEKLFDFAKNQMELPPGMYSEQKIRWVIDLNLDGTRNGQFVPWGGDTKANKRGEPIVVPFIGRTVGVKPKLLADSVEYVLGVGRPDSKPDRVADCHQQFKALIQKCSAIAQEPKLIAVQTFLNNWNPNQLSECLPDGFKIEKFDASENMTFRVDGVVLADARMKLKSIEQFWADYTSGADDGAKEPAPIMTCLITGEPSEVAQRMPVLIKGLIGGQPSGTALVSANSDPFTSYGLKNSLSSPISRDAAEKFAKALNHLLADEKTRLYVGSTAYVFWTRKKTEFDPIGFLKAPDSQAVKNLIESPMSGSQVHSDTDDQFYALSLSASMARSVVRDWLETTIPNVRENLKRWFIHQKMVDGYGAEGRSFSVYALAASAYRDPSKEMQPTVPTALIRHALGGGRLPEDLLVKMVRRNRAEQEVTYPRAVLIKLVLISQGKLNMIDMDALNLNPQLEPQENTAYQCGRLLAELEAIQRTAQGNTNATLVDRYYGAASSTPAKAFAPLMRGVQNHLSKLRKNSPGLYKLCDQHLEEIMSNFPEKKFPSTLAMREQAIFSLGYYHQRAANRAAIAKAKADKAEKAAEKATPNQLGSSIDSPSP
jgi:CRISPR-associated protein Csd1